MMTNFYTGIFCVLWCAPFGHLFITSQFSSHILCRIKYFCYLCKKKTYQYQNMCTITLTYDKSNALARRKLASLLASGLFHKQEVKASEPTREELEAHRELRDAILNNSKKSMSHLIARYL